MQRAVDVVGGSEHPTNKIAATLAGADHAGRVYSVTEVNYWPEPIRKKIGTETRIGNASGTVHAETACIFHARAATEGASMFVTDLPCPNCVKNVAEAGVRNLYIDHKGFDKDFARRRGGDFQNMALHICEKAGINVFKLFRKEERMETILAVPEGYSPVLERPARIVPLAFPPNHEKFGEMIEDERRFHDRRAFASAIARDHTGRCFLVSAEIHPIIGFTAHDPAPDDAKYNYYLQPVHRVLMNAARKGLAIEPTFLYSSRVPTARELVNLVGAGFESLIIGDTTQARDADGLKALKQLVDADILSFNA